LGRKLRRSLTEARLAWTRLRFVQDSQKSLGLGEERKHERIMPRVSTSKLILPNGEVHNCRIIDVSLSGASVACSVKPPIDTVVILGRMRGRIVRHHDQGIALQFVELQDPDSLARSFG
jgi:hypothetical protein